MAYLEKIQVYLKEQGWEYRYSEEDGCGSIDFDYRGVPYHIWEFDEGERGWKPICAMGAVRKNFTEIMKPL